MPTETEKQNVAYTVAIKKAGIERGIQGRPVRSIVERGHRKPVGKFASLKCGMAMPWESFHELHLMWLSEADASVESYLAQPFRMWFRLTGMSRPIDYFPDLERRLTGGRWEVIEVKRTRDEVTDEPYYERKIGMARKIGRVEGFHFRVMTAEDHIDVGPRLKNAEAIVRDRWTTITAADKEAFLSAAERHGRALPYARAVEVLSPFDDRFDPIGRARLHALVVRRIAWIDIYRPIGADAPVRAVEGRKRAAA